MSLQQQLRNGLLIVLKYTLNPLTRRLARSSFGLFTIVRHVGRRSGKLYGTPIIVSPVEDGFVTVYGRSRAAQPRHPAAVSPRTKSSTQSSARFIQE